MQDKKPHIIRRLVNVFVESLSGKEFDLTSGSIRRAVVLLSIPMILEMIGEAIFAIVDMFWVSKISTEAVAAVGFTESVLSLLYAVAVGISMAATALVARRIGEGNKDAARESGVQAIIYGTVVSAIIGVLGIIYAPNILQLMGAEEAVITEGVSYTRIILGGNITIMLLFIINAVFRGAGDAKTAMWVLLIANVINIILDPLFIFGFGMGIKGAAIATTTGRGIAVLIQLFILFNGWSLIKIAIKDIKLNLKLLKNLIDVSLGGIGQYLIATASWVVLMWIMGNFSTEVVAGYQIAIRNVMFFIYPAWGMSNAAATLVGQNLGAGKPDRAEKSVWKTGKYVTIFMAIISVFLAVMAKPLAKIFSNDPEVIKWATLSMIIFAIGYIMFAFGMVLTQAFNGAGDTKTPTWINFICFWLIEIPLAYLAALHWGYGPSGVLWSVIVAETVLAAIAFYLFKKGNWKLKQV